MFPRVFGALSLVVSLCLLSFAGCSRTPAKSVITGRVFIEDQPMDGGTVTWNPNNAAPQSGEIQSDGNYKIEDALAGEGVFTVMPKQEGMAVAAAAIRGQPYVDPDKVKKKPTAVAKKKKKKGPPEKDKTKVDAKYQVPANSPFVETVPAGKHVKDLKLEGLEIE